MRFIHLLSIYFKVNDRIQLLYLCFLLMTSSCAALFDFPSSCGVHFIRIERSIIQSKI